MYPFKILLLTIVRDTTVVEVEGQKPEVLFSRLMNTERDAPNSSIAMEAGKKKKQQRSIEENGLPIDAVRPDQIGMPVMKVSDD